MSLARLRELRSGLDILKSAVVVRKFVTLGPFISRNFELGCVTFSVLVDLKRDTHADLAPATDALVIDTQK
jgi:hypothetical protein